MIYYGIDNGVSGAIARIDDQTRDAFSVVPIPVTKLGKGKEIDGRGLAELLARDNAAFVLVERPGKFSRGVHALCSTWDSYGTIKGILAALKLRWQAVEPKAWQKEMFAGLGYDDTKAASIAAARRLFPSLELRPTQHGQSDALLIAERPEASALTIL